MTTVDTTTRQTFDAQDEATLARYVASRDARGGARVGDYVILPDGAMHRFSHDWGDGLQSSKGGSWYLADGYASFSGSLYDTISRDHLHQTDYLMDGWFWFFHHDMPGAARGVNFAIPCRVFTIEVTR